MIWQNPFGAGKMTSTLVFTDVTLLNATSATAWEEDESKSQIDDSTGKPIGVRKSHVLLELQKRQGCG